MVLIHAFLNTNQVYKQPSTRRPTFKKFVELQGKSLEIFDKEHIEIVAWPKVKLYQNIALEFNFH